MTRSSTSPLRRAGDRGQVSVELLGMTPIIIVTLVLLWQFVLVGYTFVLAGNAADEAVRAATASAGQAGCEQAGRRILPGAWQGTVTCHADGQWVTADVSLKVPVLFPGAIGFPFTVKGHAGAVQEED